MAPRAQWKGFIKFGEVTVPVALYTAASASDRIAFATVNRATGNRVRREFVDTASRRPVEKEDQVKGYEVGNGRYVVLEPDEVASAVPESDKTLSIRSFIPCGDLEKVYFDKPYYLSPDKMGAEAYALLRDGMRNEKVAAIAQAVLFRRVRTVLVRAHGDGLIATTLNFDYEVRSADEAFEDVPDLAVEGEMLDLARHIIGTKKGTFVIEEAEDRYEAALADLVRAKLEGRTLPKQAVPRTSSPDDLLEALRKSAALLGAPPTGRAVERSPSSKRGTRHAKAARQVAGSSASARQRRAG